MWSQTCVAYHNLDVASAANLSASFSCIVIHACSARVNELHSYLLSFHWLTYVSPCAACKLKPLPPVVCIFLNTMSANRWPDFVLQISSSITHTKLQELSTNLSCISLSTHRCTVIALNQSTAKFQGLGMFCVRVEVVCGYFHVQTMKRTFRASDTSPSQTL